MMRKFLAPVLITAALLLSACGALGALMAVPSAPVAVADKSVLDEQLASGAELAYKAERLALELAVDTGQLKGDRAAQAARLDNQAFQALQAVRAAYRAGNAADYRTAYEQAKLSIAAALAVINPKG